MHKGMFAAKILPPSVGAGVLDRPAAVHFLFWERQANSESCTREVQEAFPYGKNIRFPRKQTWR